jgi:hypothetical protein
MPLQVKSGKKKVMNVTAQIAKQIREVHFGGNWTDVDLKQSLDGVDWQQATAKVYSLNTIANLVFHMNYYVCSVMTVLKNEPLESKQEHSFDLKPINSAEDWEKLMDKTWADAADFAALVEALPEKILGETFAEEKYGNYFRNITGVIEHTHYHLGQIVFIKKIISHLPVKG